MKYFIYVVVFLICMINPLHATTVKQQEVKEIRIHTAKKERPAINPTDDEISQYDEAISDQVEIPKISPALAFVQNMGIEILLCYLAIKRNMSHYFNLLKQNLWQVSANIIKLKG